MKNYNQTNAISGYFPKRQLGESFPFSTQYKNKNISIGKDSKRQTTLSTLLSSTNQSMVSYDAARDIGKNLFKIFHKGYSQYLQDFQIIQMIKQTYKGMKIENENTDIDLMKKVLDCDKDGKVTQRDFITLSQKYFTTNIISK